MDKSLLTTEPFLTGRPLAVWFDSMGITDWSINAEGLVDVDGSVDLRGDLGTLKRLPVRFGKVGGDFYCDNNQLVSLEGAPKEVGGDFYCHENQLVSLEGGPKEVGGSFDCDRNQLVSLEGAPERVGGDFYCSKNQLVSLEGVPKEVGEGFWCYHNQLVDFKGMEGVSIEGDLTVTDSTTAGQDNVFVSLDGLPKELYRKVVGLDIPAMLELRRKRAAGLSGDEEEELISEVELG